MHDRQFGDATGFFENAFRIAESDSDSELTAYAQGGNYHLRKLLLWECYLESAADKACRAHLRAVFNMGIDENEIQQLYRRESLPHALSCRNYFYLLLQEHLLLFDEEFRSRVPPQVRLERMACLLDLLENPHCSQREDNLINRARTIEHHLQGRLASVLPDARYTRAS